MGLDQYAFSANDENVNRQGIPEHSKTDQIAYWRKHNRLHGWMEKCWNEKGRPNATEPEGANPYGSSFNCVPLEITAYDLDQLEGVVLDKKLPETGGFFFGSDSYELYEDFGFKKDDLDFIREARRLIGEGKRVFYDSSW